MCRKYPGYGSSETAEPYKINFHLLMQSLKLMTLCLYPPELRDDVGIVPYKLMNFYTHYAFLLQLKSYSIGYHGYKFGVCGFTFTGVDGVAEDFVHHFGFSSCPCDFY